ncbi:MAG: App1 family protein [Gemmatimonadaceae bacterium]
MNGWLHDLRRFIDRDPYMIAGYRSYGSSQRVLVRGRAMENEGVTPAGERDSVWRNLVNSYRRIEADPLAHAVVRATVAGAVADVIADDEGFFSTWVDLPAPVTAPDGWIPVGLELLSPREGATVVTAEARALLAPPGARFIVISDMDDTVLQSHVTSLVHAFRTVLLGNARTRLPFPGVAAFYRALHAGAGGNEANPIFYVSSSPWNLYDLLVDFLDNQGIPAGPLTLRDWDLDRSALGGGRLHRFKDAAIREIMATYPHLPVILIGDSSQQDPEIYRDVVREFPERVLAIYIRDVKRTVERRAAITSLIAEVKAAKSVLILADDTLAAARHAADSRYIDAGALAEIGGEKRQDEAAAPGKVGSPAVKEGESDTPPTVIDER